MTRFNLVGQPEATDLTQHQPIPDPSYRDMEQRLELRLAAFEHQIAEKLKQIEDTIEIPRSDRVRIQDEVREAVKALESGLREEVSRSTPSFTTKQAATLRDLLQLLLAPLQGELSVAKFLHYWRGLNTAPIEVDEFGMDLRFREKVRPLFRFLYESYWRVETRGIHNIPDSGAQLIVANHSGTLPHDGSMIATAIDFEHPRHRAVRPLIEDFVFHFPYLGTFMNRCGGVRACQENAQKLLEKGNLVVVFPEGVKGLGKPFKDRYKLTRFGRGGFVRLALRSSVPIVPTSVVGAEEIHPMLFKIDWLSKILGLPYVPVTPTLPWFGLLGLIPFPSKWTIEFGERLDYSHYGPEAEKDPILVNKLTQEVRSKIQHQTYTLLKARKSIWFG